MKKKLIVIVIAVVLVAAMVGTCFALYTKAATPKTITLTAGSGVTLGFTGGELSITALNPTAAQTYDLVLTATNTDKAEAGKQGRFKVTIAAHDSENAADVALAAALQVSATGYYNGETEATGTYSGTHSELTAGQSILLSKIPTHVKLSFSLAEAAFLAGAAEGQVDITLNWDIVDWALDNNAYYLVGSMNGWAITNDVYKFVAPTEQGNTNLGELIRVYLPKDTEFKINKGDFWENAHGESSAITGGQLDYANGNTIVKVAGYFSFYLNSSSQLFVDYSAE